MVCRVHKVKRVNQDSQAPKGGQASRETEGHQVRMVYQEYQVPKVSQEHEANQVWTESQAKILRDVRVNQVSQVYQVKMASQD